MVRIAPLEGPGAPDPSEVKEFLSRGLIVGIPTDTLYGLAVDPFSETAVRRILEAKGRDDGKALPVLVGCREHLDLLGVTVSAELLGRLFALWPSPLTAVLPVRAPVAAGRGGGTLAVRLPAFPPLVRLLLATGPVTATSANVSGAPPARSAAEVSDSLGRFLALVLDGGPSSGGSASTVVDLSGPSPRILREGAFSVPVNHFR